MESFVLVDNWVEYYGVYLRSLINPKYRNELPVLTSQPEILEKALSSFNIPIKNWTRKNELCFCDTVQDLINQLIALTKKTNPLEFDNLYTKLKQIISNEFLRPNSFIVGNSQAASLGVLRALYDGREYLAINDLRDRRLLSLKGKATDLYIVTDILTEDDVLFIHNHFLQSKRDQPFCGISMFPIGYLHGRNLEMMTFLDAKQRLFNKLNKNSYSFNNIVIDAFLNQEPIEKCTNVKVIPYSKVNAELLRNQQNINVLAVTSHGMSDLVHLNQDYLCGKSPYLSIDSVNGRFPCCMYSPYQCQKTTGNALLAHEVSAQHVLINSCGSLKFKESDFDPLFNISYSMLEGKSLSFVGSLRWKDGGGSEGLLYCLALNLGLSLGEAVSLLNASLFYNQYEASDNVYCLLGDPTTRTATLTKSKLATPISGEIQEITLKSNLEIFEILSASLIQAFFESKLLVEVAHPDSLFASIVPSQDKNKLYLLLYRYDEEEIVTTIKFHAPHQTLSKVIESYQIIEQNLDRGLGLNRLYPQNIQQGDKKDIENSVSNISRIYKSCFTSLSSVKKLSLACDRFLKKIDRIDLEIANSLYDAVRQTSFRFSEHYQTNFLLDYDNQCQGRCYICERPLVYRHLRHILNPCISRFETICVVCGGIEDKPNLNVSLEILLTEDFSIDFANNVILRIINNSEKVLSGYCLIAVRKSKDWAIEISEPIIKCLVLPNESIEQKFEVLLKDNIKIHQHVMQAAFVTNTQVFLAGRHFWTQL